ncbi:MAG: AAA family ATPase [Syntrophales bacterium]|nr:AAA family ATPase [Syntrophales bacterium]
MPQVWPIGGGKGGSGKSFFTGSLGIMLAKEGHKTLLIDVDLGAANLHTILGMTSHPEKSLSDFVNRKVDTLEDIIIPTSTPNLNLISGAMNNLDIANLAYEQKNRLLRHIVKLPYDYILLDLGAGTSFNTIDFFMISATGIFITAPEPTSIENIYRLIRAVYFRRVKQMMSNHTFKSIAEEAEARNSRASVTNPNYLLYVIKEIDPEKGKILENSLNRLEFFLFVNQHRKQDNPLLGKLMTKIIEKHLTMKIHFGGNISFDDRVHNAVCKNMPFIELYPYTRTALDLRECFNNLRTSQQDQVSDIDMAVQ